MLMVFWGGLPAKVFSRLLDTNVDGLFWGGRPAKVYSRLLDTTDDLPA